MVALPFVCSFVCVSVCLSVCLFVFVCLFVCLFVPLHCFSLVVSVSIPLMHTYDHNLVTRMRRAKRRSPHSFQMLFEGYR